MHNRFFIEETIGGHSGNQIVLESITAHVRAFSKKAGDEIKLYDGSGNIYGARILQILKRKTVVELISMESAVRRGAKIHLFLPLLTSHIMDQLIARACELEVGCIFPVITERSINLKSGKEIDFKLSKWNKISMGSMIIAGKAFATSIGRPVSLSGAFRLVENFDAKLIAVPDAPLFLKDFLLSFDLSVENISIAMFIGPEGDFSPDEIDLSRECGLTAVKLSNYIMSTFVASLYAVSNLTCFSLTGNRHAS